MSRIIKRCPVCKSEYTPEAWVALPVTGVTGRVVFQGRVLEHRQCSGKGCRNTLCIDAGPSVASALTTAGRIIAGRGLQ